MNRYLFAIILTLIFRPGIISAADGDRALHWPSWRGDAALTGVAGGKLAAPLKRNWTFKTKRAFKATPIIVGDTLYIGSHDGKLYALNVDTGKQLWATDTGASVEAPAYYAEGKVFVSNLDGRFMALAATTGDKLWEFKIDDKFMGAANSFHADDKLRVVVGGYDNQLHCMDGLNGTPLWSYETDNYINGSPAIGDGAIVFGGCDAKVHIVGLDGEGVAAVDSGKYIAGSAAVRDGFAYVGNYGSQVVCVDLQQHKVVWEYESKLEESPFFSSPATDGQRVVIGGRDRLVHCLNAVDGKPIWTVQTRDEVNSSPVICDGKVVVGSDDGRLYLLRLTDGAVLWKYEIGAPLTGSPAVVDGKVYIAAEDGTVFGFHKEP